MARRSPRGAYFDATYRERERSLACRFRLCRDIALWPFDVTGAEYFSTAGRAAGARIPVGGDVIVGTAAVADPSYRRPARRGDAGRRGADQAGDLVRGLPHRPNLPIYLCGAEADAIALYEQLISQLHRRLLPLSR